MDLYIPQVKYSHAKGIEWSAPSKYGYTEKETEVLDYAIASFGYLMNTCYFNNKAITFSRFGELIEEAYDTNEPRTAYIIKLLKRSPMVPGSREAAKYFPSIHG